MTKSKNDLRKENIEVFENVKKQINIMILEAYEGMGIKKSLRNPIMVFVEHAIQKTITAKDKLLEAKE